MLRQQDPKPEIFRIEELVQRVKTGDIKLPKFQRIFVWKKTDILNLLDSVYKGYPIGSILLWLTNQKLASERRIGDLEINDRPEAYPVNYLLDGQQRLSTLCGALYWDGKDPGSMWNINFDLEKEEFFCPNQQYPEVWHFPMNKLLGTFEFLNQCKRFESHPNKDKYEKNSQRLLQTIKDYKIAAVTIGDMSIDEVAPIFERINSTGRSLTIVDLMRAATWKEGFDLNEAIQSIRDSLKAKKFDSVSDGEILKNISASSDFGIHKDDVNKLRKLTSSELQQSVQKCTKAYQLAVDFLTSDLPVVSYPYLPYKIQLTLMVEFFRINKHPDFKKRENLKRWFWHTAFSAYFRSTNYSLIRGALAQIRYFSKNKIDKVNVDKTINHNAILLDNFSLNKASSKSFAILLAYNQPKSLMDGSYLNLDSVLAVANKHEFHHIFPRNFLLKQRINNKYIDSHANICLLSSTNNKKISDKPPSEYFSEIKNLLGNSLQDVLESNFISKEAFEACLNDDYRTFIEVRSQTLIKTIKELTNT